MRNASEISCRENSDTYFMFNNFFFRTSRRLWDNVEKYGTAGQTTENNTVHAYCIFLITKVTNINSEHVLIITFPRQQWLRERTWMSHLYVDLYWLSGSVMKTPLTLILLTWRIWWAPNNASKWEKGFNSAFKELKVNFNLEEATKVQRECRGIAVLFL